MDIFGDLLSTIRNDHTTVEELPYIIEETKRRQRDEDIRNTILCLLEIRQSDDVIKHLLCNHFHVVESELDSRIRDAKEIDQYQLLINYLYCNERLSPQEVEKYEKKFEPRVQIEHRPELLDLPVEKLKKEIEKFKQKRNNSSVK